MKKFLNTVTVTGADDSVSFEEMVRIQRHYPFVEFGILLSKKQQGNPRFPSERWLNDLSAVVAEEKVLRLAGHVCGQWVREIYMGTWPARLSKFSPGGYFGRYQLNTHGEPHEARLDGLAGLLSSWRCIIQYDNTNNAVLEGLIQRGKRVEALFDLSHGAGVLPGEWSRPIPGVGCGYAGGLSPENVAEQLARIGAMVGDEVVWIDAETHLRSNRNGRDVFDMEKVVRFLEAAKPWVIGES